MWRVILPALEFKWYGDKAILAAFIKVYGKEFIMAH